MGENNNGSRWQIGFWVITVLVVGSFTWTTLCAMTNQSKIDFAMQKLYDLKEVANEALHKIDIRLSRIEDRLGVKNDSTNARMAQSFK